MNESRDSRLAAILARGLKRVRQRAERAGQLMIQHDDSQSKPVVEKTDPEMNCPEDHQHPGTSS